MRRLRTAALLVLIGTTSLSLAHRQQEAPAHAHSRQRHLTRVSQRDEEGHGNRGEHEHESTSGTSGANEGGGLPVHRCGYGFLDDQPGFGKTAALTPKLKAAGTTTDGGRSNARAFAAQSLESQFDQISPLEVIFDIVEGQCDTSDGVYTPNCFSCKQVTQNVGSPAGGSITCEAQHIVTDAHLAYARTLGEHVSDFFRKSLNVRELLAPTYVATSFTKCGSYVDVPAVRQGYEVTHDLIVLVTFSPLSTNDAEGGTAFAFSSVCLREGTTQRALMAVLNLNPAVLGANAEATALGYKNGLRLQNDVDAIIHELTHVIGFSSDLVNHNGYLELDESGFNLNNQAIINQFSSERSQWKYYVVTPRALEVAKEYFGCSDLGFGVELEDTASSTMHWEGRIFADDLMTYQRASLRRFQSSLTMAFLLDTGLYTAGEGTASNGRVWTLDAKTTFHGRGGGCAFAMQPCVANRTDASAPMQDFCFPTTVADVSTERCNRGRTARGYCNVRLHTDYLSSSERYFDYLYPSGNDEAGRIGGGYAHLDHCPTIVPYANKACVDAANRDYYNVFGNSYGSDSRCFESNVIFQGFDSGSETTRCFPVDACDDDSRTYTVLIGGEHAVECSPDVEGGVVDVEEATGGAFAGAVTCAPYDEVCPPTDTYLIESRIAASALDESDAIDDTRVPVDTPFVHKDACATRWESCFLPALQAAWDSGRCHDATRAWATCFAADCPYEASLLVTSDSPIELDLQSGGRRSIATFRANCSNRNALTSSCTGSTQEQLDLYCNLLRTPSAAWSPTAAIIATGVASLLLAVLA
jgi:hypothetical protein